MAAGMGSRFGGLKQIEPIGPNQEFLIDYSIYDAVKAGFTKVVFVIKRENEAIFKETVGNRVSKAIQVAYAFQDINDLPAGFIKPDDRVKPWGTAHAILCAKAYIQEPFAIINADDFYGYDAYRVIADFLDHQVGEHHYGVVGYFVKNTLSPNGAVKRAVCKAEKNLLTELIESSIIKQNNKITASPLSGKAPFTVQPNDFVSMNMFGFDPSIFPFLENGFVQFLQTNSENLKSEYLIPDAVMQAKSEGFARISVLPTTAIWQGITYQEDKEPVKLAIRSMIDEKIYPDHLWDKKSTSI